MENRKEWFFKIIAFYEIIVLLLLIPLNVLGFCQDQKPALQNGVADMLESENLQNSTGKIQILSPFTDIEFDKMEHLKLIKTNMGVFVLNGNSVYHVNISHDSKDLKFVSELHDIGVDVTGFYAIPWGKHLIFIISLIDHYNVYIIELPISEGISVNPIQKVAIYGKFRKIVHFFKSQDLYLVMATNFTEMHGRLSFYKWEQSSFHLKEEQNMQPISDLFVLNENSNPLVFAVKYGKRRSKTSLQIFMLAENNNLKRTQNFYLDSNLILPFTFHGDYYIIGCSSRLKICTTYSITDDELIEFNSETFNTTFTKLSYGKDYIVGEKPGGEFHVVADIKLKCYGVFKSNETDLSHIFTHMDDEGYNFVLLTYMRPSKVLIRVVDIIFHPLDSGQLKSSYNTLDMSLSRLQSLLLSRKSKIDTLKEIVHSNGNDFDDMNKFIIKSPIHVIGGHVEKVTVIGSNLSGLHQLRDKLKDLRRSLKDLTNKTDRRIKRNTKVPQVKNLRVQNLMYNGSIFEGIKKTADNQLLINATLISVNSIETRQLEVNNNSTTYSRAENFDDGIITKVHLKSNNLITKKINGIDWEKFYNEIFLKSRDSIIEGNLTIQGPVHITNLRTNTLNTKAVDSFFTLTTEQDVFSSILISKLSISSLKTDELNGLKFETDVATVNATNNNVVIKSPVIVHSMKIEKELTLAEKARKNFARYLFGSRLEDFLQIYTKKVVINGSLTLNNVNLLKDSSTLKSLVSGQEFNFDFMDRYWLKTFDQKFEQVTFTETVSFQKLKINHLNGIEISNYLLKNGHSTGRTLLVFNSSMILGNIQKDDKFPSSKLSEINRNVIRRGERANIFDLKNFHDGITVDILETAVINNIRTEDYITNADLSSTVSFDGRKNFTILEVNDEFTVDNLNVEKVNGIDLRNFFATAKRLDASSLTMTTLILSDLAKFEIIFINNINQFNMPRLMDIMEITNDHLLLHKKITIDGDVVFEKNLKSISINNVKWDEYLKLIVFLNETSEIGGTKIFVDSLTIKDRANIHAINGNDMNEFMHSLLLKTRFQTIKKPWNFESVNFNLDLSVPIINGITTTHLIDARDTDINIASDLIVKDLFQVDGNIYGNISIDFTRMENAIKYIDQQYWEEIKILQNVIWQTNNGGGNDLDYLAENAVLAYSDQIISGNVVFTGSVYINSVNNSLIINGIDIYAIYNDCLLTRKDTNQLVIAGKTFDKKVHFNQLIARNYFAAEIINNVEILGFNASIFRVTGNLKTITGWKNFVKPPLIEYLDIYGTVNDIDLSNILYVPYRSILPPIKISDLIINGSVSVEKINEYDFNSFLGNRVRKSGPAQDIFGYLTFESLVLKNNVTLTSINNVEIDEIILKDSQFLQEIYGIKRISGNISLIGPAHIAMLNNIDVITKFQNSIFLDENYNFKSITAKQVSFDNGFIVNEILNDHQVDEYFSRYEKFYANVFSDLQLLDESFSKTQNIIERLHLGQRFMYLEYDKMKTVIWNRTTTDNIIKEYIINENCNISDEMCLCGKKNLAVKISSSGRIYMNYISRTQMKSKLENFRVSIENNCIGENRTTEISILWKSRLDQMYYEKNMTINSLIGKLDSFEVLTNQNSKFLLIQFVSGPVLLIKVDIIKNQLSRIQSFKHEDIELDLNSQIYSFPQNIFLVMARNSTISIYEFSSKEECFRKIYNITGIYDIYDLIQIDSDLYHLVISCKSCQHIAIYEINVRTATSTTTSDFYLFQKLHLKTHHVDNFSNLISPSGRFLIITTKYDEDYYYLYKYSYMEGWTYATFGYFPNIQFAISLPNAANTDKDYILISSKNSSTAVLVYSQG